MQISGDNIQHLNSLVIKKDSLLRTLSLKEIINLPSEGFQVQGIANFDI